MISSRDSFTFEYLCDFIYLRFFILQFFFYNLLFCFIQNECVESVILNGSIFLPTYISMYNRIELNSDAILKKIRKKEDWLFLKNQNSMDSKFISKKFKLDWTWLKPSSESISTNGNSWFLIVLFLLLSKPALATSFSSSHVFVFLPRRKTIQVSRLEFYRTNFSPDI